MRDGGGRAGDRGLETARLPATSAIETRIAGDPWSAHGGAIFSLADFTFAGACNGHGEPAVALTVTIQFHVPARVGRRLVAEARETRQGRRAGFYAMTVTDETDGTVVATCQAVSLRTDAPRPHRPKAV